MRAPVIKSRYRVARAGELSSFAEAVGTIALCAVLVCPFRRALHNPVCRDTLTLACRLQSAAIMRARNLHPASEASALSCGFSDSSSRSGGIASLAARYGVPVGMTGQLKPHGTRADKSRLRREPENLPFHRLRSHDGMHLAATAADLRPVRADRAPPLHRVELGPCMGQTPPPDPG